MVIGEFLFFIDDPIGVAISFKVMFNFLHHYYFSRVFSRSVYLGLYKTFVFTDQLNFAGFIGDKNGLSSLMKHREQI